MSEGRYGSELHVNHTYKALRVVGEGYSLLYTLWCSGERELYDLLVSFCISLSHKRMVLWSFLFSGSLLPLPHSCLTQESSDG